MHAVPIPVRTSLFICLIFGAGMLCSFNPPVSVFEPEEYKAGNQNWMIDQAPDDAIIVANGEGLLVYNGAQWQLFRPPGSAVTRSVRTVGDRIYSGGYMDFGFWTRKSDGRYDYTSLADKIPGQLINDEQCWNILVAENRILFQTLRQLYLYDPLKEKIEIIPSKNGVNKCFRVGERIFFQDFSRDLYEVSGLNPELAYPSERLPKSEIINLFYSEHGLLLFTKKQGFFRLRGDRFVVWDKQDPLISDPADFFSAIQLKNGQFAIGSITQGIFILSNDGQVIYHIDQLTGISNNTVLALFEDRSRNVWVGLDNGINALNLKGPFREYMDKAGLLGTVYTATVYREDLYIGTNQGLFYRPRNSRKPFTLVKNSNGQVWELDIIDDVLFCGHNLGTFIIRDGAAMPVSDVLGTWKLESMDDSLPAGIIQGNYDGLHILRKDETGWKYSHRIEGIDFSCRHFVKQGQWVYLFHPSEGLVRYRMDQNWERPVESDVLPGTKTIAQASLASVGGHILFSHSKGIDIVSSDFTRLIPMKGLPGDLCRNNTRFPVLVHGEDNRFWMICHNGLIEGSVITGDSIAISKHWALSPVDYRSKYEFENVSRLGQGELLCGMTNGFLVIDETEPLSRPEKSEIRINGVKITAGESTDQCIDVDQAGRFRDSHNNIQFSYHIPYPGKYRSVLYQYRLEGENQGWSELSPEPFASFYKLKPGNYRFLVRAREGGEWVGNTAEYRFRILQPWYFSGYAFAVYFAILLLIVLTINYMYSTIYQNRQQKIMEKADREMLYLKLKNEQELMQEKNERLRAEIDAKNKELAVTAMGIVKKNEFLIQLRDEMQNRSPDQVIMDKMIGSVNLEIENEESWEMLRSAFENVDKDFIQVLMARHAELTPNDLKLCTYLRLNLNSKEIASLMNISVRSMETKRYRLRKKLGLEHDENLVEYILSI